METSRVVFISDFFYDNHTRDDFFRDGFFYLKLHALFNCLTAEEIKVLYFNHAVHSDKFKGTLLNFVGRKSASRSLDFSSVAAEVIEEYPNQPYAAQSD